MSMLPTKEENPDGLHRRYEVRMADGTPTDPDAVYFVLRLDPGGDDPEHIRTCRWAATAYAQAVLASPHSHPRLRRIGQELLELLGRLPRP